VQRTLLLAAADANIVYLLRRYAQKIGLRTVSASQGEEVVALAQQVRPAAIILEAGLPGTTGRDVLSRLRQSETARDIPVVVYTWLNEETSERTAGAVGYLRDPVLYEDFVAALEGAGVLPHSPSSR
jgi:CheY-like chemotaxis protein